MEKKEGNICIYVYVWNGKESRGILVSKWKEPVIENSESLRQDRHLWCKKSSDLSWCQPRCQPQQCKSRLIQAKLSKPTQDRARQRRGRSRDLYYSDANSPQSQPPPPPSTSPPSSPAPTVSPNRDVNLSKTVIRSNVYCCGRFNLGQAAAVMRHRGFGDTDTATLWHWPYWWQRRYDRDIGGSVTWCQCHIDDTNIVTLILVTVTLVVTVALVTSLTLIV